MTLGCGAEAEEKPTGNMGQSNVTPPEHTWSWGQGGGSEARTPGVFVGHRAALVEGGPVCRLGGLGCPWRSHGDRMGSRAPWKLSLEGQRSFPVSDNHEQAHRTSLDQQSWVCLPYKLSIYHQKLIIMLRRPPAFGLIT